MSRDQLINICICHGYKPKSKTKNGLIREIESEVQKSEAKEDSKLMLEYDNTDKKMKAKGKGEIIEVFDSDSGDDSSDEEYVKSL